jgi:hypothetical protein
MLVRPLLIAQLLSKHLVVPEYEGEGFERVSGLDYTHERSFLRGINDTGSAFAREIDEEWEESWHDDLYVEEDWEEDDLFLENLNEYLNQALDEGQEMFSSTTDGSSMSTRDRQWLSSHNIRRKKVTT